MVGYIGPWIVAALVVVAAIMAIGRGVTGRLLGIFVDSRNKASLSRFQIVLWTVLFVSAYFTVAFEMRSLELYVPPEIWGLLAISTGSAAGAVIIKGAKGEQQPSPRINLDGIRRLGVLALGDKPRFTDIFRGDEIEDAKFVDVSKVQMFFFTIAAIGGYIVALLHCDLKAIPADVTVKYVVYFPKLSAGLLTLIGISHAGYLTIKAAPHTPTA
jgi:hypothetical protein